MWEGRLDYTSVLVDVGVPRDKVDDCMLWALGEGWSWMAISSTDDVWNEMHGDLFLLFGYDGVIDGLERIGRAYIRKFNN